MNRVIDQEAELAALGELGGAEDFASLGTTFRGEIYEEDQDNARIADFLKCHFHRPVFRAIRNPTVRRVGIQAANQIGKSSMARIAMKYFIKNDPGNMVIYDVGDEEMSSDHMRAEFLPLLKSVPEIQSIIEEILADNRFNVSMQDILFSGMIFRARAINETTTEKIHVRYGMISDARMTGKRGLIRRAFIRSRQYEGIEKWVVESFGGEKGDDFTEDVMRKTDLGKLWVKCPRCGCGQKFLFGPKRGDEFVAVPPLAVPSLEQAAWVNHWTPRLRGLNNKDAKAQSGNGIAGFKRGDRLQGAELFEHGKLDEGLILQKTGYECFWCGSLLEDTPIMRRALDESSYYVSENPEGVPGWAGFVIPAWINPKVSWGSCMIAFLDAMRAEREGNLLPLMEFKTKWEGETWDPIEERRQRLSQELVSGTYETDPEKLMENSHCRQCTVDGSKDQDKPHGVDESLIEWLWFDVWEWDKGGNGRQLSYGVVNGWELLAAQQRFWKVPNPRTLIDASWMPSQVEEACVKMFELVPPEAEKEGKAVRQLPYAWRLCAGAGQNRRFTVPGTNKGAAYSFDALPGKPRMGYDKTGKRWFMGLFKLTWSNGWFERQLDSILAGGSTSKLEFLPREKVAIIGLDGKISLELTKWSLERTKDPGVKETGKYRSYASQLNSRYYVEKTGKYEDYEKQSRPTEFRDTLLMQLAGLAPDGLLGHPGTLEGDR